MTNPQSILIIAAIDSARKLANGLTEAERAKVCRLALDHLFNERVSDAELIEASKAIRAALDLPEVDW